MNSASLPYAGRIGVARRDITPPPGIYNKNWGAAEHETAIGVHRPLTATVLAFEDAKADAPLIIVAVDLGFFKSPSDELLLRQPILSKLSLDESRLLINLSHTHAGPSLCTQIRGRPGEEMVGPYLQHVSQVLLEATEAAVRDAQPATLDWAYGFSTVATNRDLPDPADSAQLLVGYNPDKAADPTLLVGRICDESGRSIATIVNYACHPTTLAWENRLISPDYVGAMRDTVERETGAPCLFLQGASGDLAPAHQYVGDTEVADRIGRSLGYSVLATLQSMPPSGTRLKFEKAVRSGAPLAQWLPQPAPVDTTLDARQVMVPLPLKPQPDSEQLRLELDQCDDPVMAERLFRKLGIANYVGKGPTCPMPLWVWRIGGALFFAQPNEAYSDWQLRIRQKWAGIPVVVMNVTNGTCGYLVPLASCRPELYAFWQSPFEQGGYEVLEHASLSCGEELMPVQG